MEPEQLRERIVAELVELFKTSAEHRQLATSESLLVWLPRDLADPEAPLHERVEAIECLLHEVIEQHRDGRGKRAENIRAANELLGWTTRTDQEVRDVLVRSGDVNYKNANDIERVDFSSKTVRYILAGDQFSKPRGYRSVKDNLGTIASYLADALMTNTAKRAAAKPVEATHSNSTGHTSADVGGSDARRGARRTKIYATVAAVIAVGLLAGVGVGAWLVFEDGSGPGDTAETNTTSTPPAVRQAVVRYTEGHGLNTFLGPGNNHPRGNPSNLPEGTVIAVVCQERDGQVVHDPTGDPNRYTKPWSVWDKLSNGLWVSDLYTDLPKNPGSTPPDDIPHC